MKRQNGIILEKGSSLPFSDCELVSDVMDGRLGNFVYHLVALQLLGLMHAKQPCINRVRLFYVNVMTCLARSRAVKLFEVSDYSNNE